LLTFYAADRPPSRIPYVLCAAAELALFTCDSVKAGTAPGHYDLSQYRDGARPLRTSVKAGTAPGHYKPQH